VSYDEELGEGMEIRLPYRFSTITATLPDHIAVDLIEPALVPPAENPLEVVRISLDNPVSAVDWEAIPQAKRVGIAINDKTRPVPHQHLLPPLMEHLERLGVPDEAITFYIAVGSHEPMRTQEFPTILPDSIPRRYKVKSHDSVAKQGLIFLGVTKRGTAVWTNEDYYRSDIKIVVGSIAPHQFMGFSGGVKTAAIGLGGLITINQNHAMMTNPNSELGRYADNPARQDVEEIGRMIGVDLAVNVVLTQNKKIIHALTGDPQTVMKKGIPQARRVCQVAVNQEYRLMIASPGGHPKDIDVYQAQKGMYNAGRITHPGGTMILAAACPEGAGSSHYAEWMAGKKSYDEVLETFTAEGFRIGPHKAFLIARDAVQFRLLLFSEIDQQTAAQLLLEKVEDFQKTVDQAVFDLEPGERVGVIPHAASTIPYVAEGMPEND
jgi:nickel-dependent lactate racemase